MDVDDAFEAAVEFQNGAVGTLEATRFAPGRKNANTFEINGERGSIAFDLERMNNLQVYLAGTEPQEANGFRDVLVTEAFHPFWEHWWPQGHIIGWEHTFVHELAHFLDAVVERQGGRPLRGDLRGRLQERRVCDAIVRSAREGRRVEIAYE